MGDSQFIGCQGHRRELLNIPIPSDSHSVPKTLRTHGMEEMNGDDSGGQAHSRRSLWGCRRADF